MSRKATEQAPPEPTPDEKAKRRLSVPLSDEAIENVRKVADAMETTPARVVDVLATWLGERLKAPGEVFAIYRAAEDARMQRAGAQLGLPGQERPAVFVPAVPLPEKPQPESGASKPGDAEGEVGA